MARGVPVRYGRRERPERDPALKWLENLQHVLKLAFGAIA